jgi:geranylgeranyl diphosphate synthase type II
MNTGTLIDIESYLQEKSAWLDSRIYQFMPHSENQAMARLLESMNYSVRAGGKRIRPLLMLATAECFGSNTEHLLPSMAAIEMIHTYSLIHDDLPSMDNDDLRRGLPTNHKKYGEATAILAGDALMTYAYEVVVRYTDRTKVNSKVILQIIQEIGQATGVFGMVGGQMMDLYYESLSLSAQAGDLVKEIHQRKTGALIRAAVRMGALLMHCTQMQLDQLTIYANHLGLAFQIVDDILDVEGSPQELGKNPGSDRAKQKLTYPAVFGLEQSKQLAREQATLALSALDHLNGEAELLRALTDYIVTRRK